MESLFYFKQHIKPSAVTIAPLTEEEERYIKEGLDWDLGLTEEDLPSIDKRTGRETVRDPYTGELLDAETLLPIDSYVDFLSRPIL